MLASSPDTVRQARLDRIQSFSRLLAWSCGSLAILLTTGLLLFWSAASTGSLAAGAQIPAEWLADLGIGRRAAGFAISFIPLACLVAALLAARRCFRIFATGEFFNHQAANGLKGFAVGLLASALLKPVSGAALSVLLSLDAPAGQHRLALGIDSDTILMVLGAGIIAVIAWVLAEASALAEENAAFV